MVGGNHEVYCQCGCGELAPIAKKTDSAKGHTKGQVLPFKVGHCNRKQKRYEVDPTTGCWNWLLAKDGGNYGMARVDGRLEKAHRIVYEETHGKLPDWVEDLDHRCKNRACVNPDHLEPVTHVENCRRGKQTKLTIEQVQEIKARVRAGGKQTPLAIEYAVSLPAISAIVHERNWKGV